MCSASELQAPAWDTLGEKRLHLLTFQHMPLFSFHGFTSALCTNPWYLSKGQLRASPSPLADKHSVLIMNYWLLVSCVGNYFLVEIAVASFCLLFIYLCCLKDKKKGRTEARGLVNNNGTNRQVHSMKWTMFLCFWAFDIFSKGTCT